MFILLMPQDFKQRRYIIIRYVRISKTLNDNTKIKKRKCRYYISIEWIGKKKVHF